MKLIQSILFISLLFWGNGCVKKPKEPQAQQQVVIRHRDTTFNQPQHIIRQQNNYIPQNAIIIDERQPPNIIPQNGVIIDERPPVIQVPYREIFDENSISSPYLSGAYANNYKLKRLIDELVNNYHFSRGYLNAVFSSVQRDREALKKIGAFNTSSKPKAKTQLPGSWDKYRAQFLTPERINKGVNFWRKNRYFLDKAYRQYGVAPEYIIGIIGVETNFGGFTGKHSLLNALTSIALEFPKRSKYFTSELKNYILLSREQKIDPRRMKGSYAGAFGLAQFMPSSFREYAVDFDGNGVIDLFTEADAIGSVANYFKEKGGWSPKIPVAMRVLYSKPRFYGIPTGFKTKYSQRYLINLGMRPTSNFYGYRGDVALIKLSRYNNDELWWGTDNFRAITKYNAKDYYAMAVHQLAQAVRYNYYKSLRRYKTDNSQKPLEN